MVTECIQQVGWRCLAGVLTVALTASMWACSDDDGQAQGQNGEECGPGEVWNPVLEMCVADDANSDPDPGDAGAAGDDAQGANVNQQPSCGPGNPTAVSGTVTIPSGELPLPDVSVYVPSTEVQPFSVGATCQPCDTELDGNVITETQTNLQGDFYLTEVPVGEDIPLVIEVGKWRRQLVIDEVQPCEEYVISDPDRTRLPANQQEGELPQFAVTTGGWDALECLLRKIGIDESEFTPEDEDGRVHLFAGRDGTDRYDASLNNGASLTPGWEWWDDLNNLLDYDIIAHSCEGSANLGDKSSDARDALRDFTEEGGRVFLSHWHNIWLDEGPSDFQSVADWGGAGFIDPVETGYIDTSFPKGQDLKQWMYDTGTTPAGQFEINEARATIQSIDETVATQWIWIEPSEPPISIPLPGMEEPPDELVQYFSFNTPVGAPPNDQCGRVVFSDIHVAADDDSSPENPFPTGCITQGLTDQEKALVFMLFDLSRCIVPDKGSGF